LRERQSEVLFAILALALRFSEASHFPHTHAAQITGYVEGARTIVSRKMFEGVVDLASIQALCLLTLVDFTGKSEVLDYKPLVDHLQMAVRDVQAFTQAWQ
jgi:hypothetical protein